MYLAGGGAGGVVVVVIVVVVVAILPTYTGLVVSSKESPSPP